MYRSWFQKEVILTYRILCSCWSNATPKFQLSNKPSGRTWTNMEIYRVQKAHLNCVLLDRAAVWIFMNLLQIPNWNLSGTPLNLIWHWFSGRSWSWRIFSRNPHIYKQYFTHGCRLRTKPWQKVNNPLCTARKTYHLPFSNGSWESYPCRTHLLS